MCGWDSTCGRFSSIQASGWRRFPKVSSLGASLSATLAGCFESWRYLLATCAAGLESWPLPVADRTSAEGLESWRLLLTVECLDSWRLPLGDARRLSRVLASPGCGRLPRVSSPGASLLATLAECCESWRFLLVTCAAGLKSWPLPVADVCRGSGLKCCRSRAKSRMPEVGFYPPGFRSR